MIAEYLIGIKGIQTTGINGILKLILLGKLQIIYSDLQAVTPYLVVSNCYHLIHYSDFHLY